MFKKVEIWIFYLFALLNVLISIAFGTLVRQEIIGERKLGVVSKTALFLAEIPTNLKKLIVDIPSDLVVEDQRFENLKGFDGTPNTQKSYLLLSRYDGNNKEGIVELIDLQNFKVLHSWNPDIDKFNNLVPKSEEFSYLKRDDNNSRKVLFHPMLTKDGGLIFGFNSPLRKIDACSDLIFQNTHDQFHHSIEKDSEGNIWASTHMYPQSLPENKVGRDIPILSESGFHDNALVKLTPNGKILFEKSLSEIFIENGLEYLLFGLAGKTFRYDPLHLNDIQPVEFDSKHWKKGDLFLSLRNQSMVILYRPSTNKIIWKDVGPFISQHDVDILNNHQISIFNNNSKFFKDGLKMDGHNQVLIYDFRSGQYSYYLNESLKLNDVRTKAEGRSQILPNGDLLVEESNHGRTLYFNKDGSLRWTHVNKADDGKIYNIGWSRILYSAEDFANIENLIKLSRNCIQ